MATKPKTKQLRAPRGAAKLDRSQDAEGALVVHPYEALQAIAVELATANKIATAQLQLAQHMVAEMKAFRELAGRAAESAPQAQQQILQMVSQALPQVLQLFGGRTDATPLPIPAPVAAPNVVALTKTARIEQAVAERELTLEDVGI